MIKTVIFDLGGVYFTDGASVFKQKIQKEFGLSMESINTVLKADACMEYRKGKVEVDAFWDFAKEQWGLDEDNEVLSLLWADCYDCIEGTVSIVGRLKSSGYRVLFVSNSVKEREHVLEQKFHFRSHFDGGVISFEVGALKPEQKMYDAALEIALCPSDQCVFIDDNESNLAPPRQMGMQTLHFTGAEKLEEDLKELGLEF